MEQSDIQSIPAALTAAQAADWTACATAMQAHEVVVRNTELVSYDTLSSRFGDAARQLVAGTIRATIAAMTVAENPLAGELSDAHAVLLNRSTGLDLSLDSRQSIIDQLAVAGSWPDALRDGIKHRAKQVTLPFADVTAEECEAAWNRGLADVAVAAAENEIINAAKVSPTRTVASITAAYRAAADLSEGV